MVDDLFFFLVVLDDEVGVALGCEALKLEYLFIFRLALAYAALSSSSLLSTVRPTFEDQVVESRLLSGVGESGGAVVFGVLGEGGTFIRTDFLRSSADPVTEAAAAGTKSSLTTSLGWAAAGAGALAVSTGAAASVAGVAEVVAACRSLAAGPSVFSTTLYFEPAPGPAVLSDMTDEPSSSSWTLSFDVTACEVLARRSSSVFPSSSTADS